MHPNCARGRAQCTQCNPSALGGSSIDATNGGPTQKQLIFVNNVLHQGNPMGVCIFGLPKMGREFDMLGGF